MTNFKKTYKKLYKNYNKKLKQLHKQSFKYLDDPVEYFVTYLKFMRDYHLLTKSCTDDLEQENLELTSLVTAIAEYEQSKSCITKYYKIENGVTIRLADDEETTLRNYSEEKAFHWDAFWSLIKLSLEGWSMHAKF